MLVWPVSAAVARGACAGRGRSGSDDGGGAVTGAAGGGGAAAAAAVPTAVVVPALRLALVLVAVLVLLRMIVVAITWSGTRDPPLQHTKTEPYGSVDGKRVPARTCEIPCSPERVAPTPCVPSLR
jgi:hypothetical protein